MTDGARMSATTVAALERRTIGAAARSPRNLGHPAIAGRTPSDIEDREAATADFLLARKGYFRRG
jgi:hypothetical protein